MEPEAKKSKLVAIGCLVMILSIGINIILQKSGIAGAVLDLFRLCFFAGLICCIIGWVRNHKLKKESQKQQSARLDQPKGELIMGNKFLIYSTEDILSKLDITAQKLRGMLGDYGNIDLEETVWKCSHLEINFDELRYYVDKQSFGISQYDFIIRFWSENTFDAREDIDYIIFGRNTIVVFKTKERARHFAQWIEICSQEKIA